MTFPADPNIEPTDPQGYDQDEPQVYEGAPVPVHVASWGVEPDRQVTPEFGVMSTFALVNNAGNPPVPLAPIFSKRQRRYKGKYMILSAGGATAIAFSYTQENLLSASVAANGPGMVFSLAGLTFPFRMPDWESQRPLYAVGIGGSPVIGAQDESYAEPEHQKS